MTDVSWNIARLSCTVALLGAVAPSLWAIGRIFGDYAGKGGIIDSVMYFFPCFLLLYIAPNAGSVVTAIVFTLASLCNVVLYGAVVFILLKIASFIYSLF